MSNRQSLNISTVSEFQRVTNNRSPIVNSTLRYDENKLFDEELVRTAESNLNGILDLREAGLVKKLGDIGVMLSAYERVSSMTKAESSMDGRSPTELDRITYDTVAIPVPVFSKDWVLNTRELEASRRTGETLESTQLTVSTRVVAELLEDTLFNGLANFAVDSNKIYGYTTHPDRIEVTLSGTGWANAAGRDIVGDVEKMVSAAYVKNRKGPFMMYVASNVWSKLFLDYSSNKSDKTFVDRIKAFPVIKDVKSSDSLANNHVVLVQMTRDVVDIAISQDITNIEMQTGFFETMYKIYAIMVPRVKSDKEGSCGIVHAKPV